MTKAGRPKSPQTERPRNLRGEGERLRGEIIDAAIAVLDRLGPDAPFSLRAVAKQARIAPPSVYIHFADRDALLLAVLERLFDEQIAIRNAAEDAAGGSAWDRLLARSLATVRFGLEQPGHYKVLFEGRAVPRLNDPRIADFGRPLLERSMELIRDVRPAPGVSRVSDDPHRLALLVWTGLHGIISLRVNKPTLAWPDAADLAEQMMRALILPA
jgi:AcrR family transcriptional regulator